MLSTRLRCGVAGFALAWLGPSSTVLAAQEWLFTALPYPAGGSMTLASGLNESGQIAGTSYGASEYAVLVQDGVVINIGSPYQSDASSINEQGQIVGSASLEPIVGPRDIGLRATLWQNGSVVNLGTLPGGGTSRATDINDVGQVVGTSMQWDFEHAVIWNQGQITDLGALKPRAINNAGQVVGSIPAGFSNMTNAVVWEHYGGFSNMTHAVVWENGQLTDLGASPGAINGSLANDINNVGQIVGVDHERAVLWWQGAKVELGSLSGDSNSNALGINDLGQVVGYSQTFANSSDGIRAVLWQNGTVLDLNTLASVQASGWTLRSATQINDKGQIIGLGVSPSGFYQSYLLSPVPEPQTFRMALMGLLALLWASKVHRSQP